MDKFCNPSFALCLLELIKHGACVRCAFRLTGVTDISTYRAPVESFKPLLEKCRDLVSAHATFCVRPVASTSVDDLLSDRICTVCLGTLQLADSNEAVEKIAKPMRAADYDFDDFNLCITLPLSTIVRQHMLVNFVNLELVPLHVSIPKSDLDIKDAMKWVLAQYICREFKVRGRNNSEFRINISYEHADTEKDVDFLKGVDGVVPKAQRRNRYKRAKSDVTEYSVSQAGLVKALGSMSAKAFFELRGTRTPPEAVATVPDVNIQFEREPTFLTGSYLKFSRSLSQTPWMIDGTRKGDASVEELIADPIQPHFKALSHKFHTAGREDIDVRMLGTGRPFVVELIDPHRTNVSQEELDAIQHQVNDTNDRIQIHGLKIVDKTYFDKLKEGEESKRKSYCCVVWLSRPVDLAEVTVLQDMKDIAIEQKTPIRVLHRRSLAVRMKMVHRIKCIYLNQHFMILHLLASAGTYIKEFIHGDLGRTIPSLGSLLNCESDILQLDVTGLFQKDEDPEGFESRYLSNVTVPQTALV
eukprot:GILJ01011104.1.p1 GENE.GILJ01011104.1~~GILJ01011104.1.p1  ORF type:complete len:528 (-),score=63.68 GILJ01011104.1:151-1734(-)